jgi:hypothetical protein
MEQYSYLVQRIADDVRAKFGDDASVQISDDDIIRWTNDGARRIATENPFLQKARKTNVLENVGLYNLGKLFATERMQKFEMVTVNGTRLDFMPHGRFLEHVRDAGPQQGDPAVAAEFGGELSIWPVPRASTAYGLVLYFWAYPDDVVSLDDQLTVPDRFVEALQAYVLAQAHELDDQMESAQAKKSDFDSLQRLARASEDMSPGEFYPTMTVLPDDFDYYSNGW